MKITSGNDNLLDFSNYLEEKDRDWNDTYSLDISDAFVNSKDTK